MDRVGNRVDRCADRHRLGCGPAFALEFLDLAVLVSVAEVGVGILVVVVVLVANTVAVVGVVAKVMIVSVLGLAAMSVRVQVVVVVIVGVGVIVVDMLLVPEMVPLMADHILTLTLTPFSLGALPWRL